MVVPALDDNYVHLVIDRAAAAAAVVDPSEAAPVEEALALLGVRLAAIWITHHHPDHVDGVADLLASASASASAPAPVPVPVLAGAGDQGRVPGQTVALADGATFPFAGQTVTVMHLPGHTRGHLAYLVGDALFSGDVLFGAGCGRLFEGTADEMFASLSRIRALPDATRVFAAHEYTLLNLPFALALEPQNEALQERLARVRSTPDAPTVPLDLAEEKQTNPFLRWDAPAIRATTGAPTPQAVFTLVRRLRDIWLG